MKSSFFLKRALSISPQSRYRATGNLLFPALLGVAACGKLHPDAGQNRKLQIQEKGAPDSDKGSVFSLLEGKVGKITGRSFAGALVLWHPELKSQAFSKVFSATKAYNQEVVRGQIEFGKFEKETLVPQLQQYRNLRKDEANAKALQRNTIDAEQAQKAEAWLSNQRNSFAEELADALAPGSSDDELKRGADLKNAFGAHFDKVIQAHCEAHILRFATSVVAARGEFWTRPSPQALCETSYAAAGLFQGEVCRPDATGANSWSCLWTEGVLKTRYWKLLPLQTQSQLAQTLAGETGRMLFQAKDEVAGAPCTSQAVRSALLKMEGVLNCPGLSSESLSMGMVVNETPVTDQKNKTLETATADKALFVFGSFITNAGRTIPQASFPDALRLLPDKLTLAGGEALSTNALLRVSLANRLKPMDAWQKDAGCSEDLKSPNDIVFNAVRLASPDSLKSCPPVEGVTQNLPDIQWRGESNSSSPSQTLLEGLESSKEKFCQIRSTEGCAEPGSLENNNTCRLKKLSADKLNAISAPKVAQAYYRDVIFTFEEESVSLVFSNGRSIKVPADLSPQKKGVWTGNPQLLLSRINSDSGALEMRIPLNPSDFSSETYIGDTHGDVKGFDKYLGQTMEIELYANALQGVRPFLSGKIVVKGRKGNILAQGVASYLIDNSFDDRVGRLCSNSLENWAP